MSLGLRVAQTFSMTILNAFTASVALGAAYAVNLKPSLVSPIPEVLSISPSEDRFIRERLEKVGFKAASDSIQIYKSLVRRQEFSSIGLVGGLNNAHIYVPESYFLPDTATFRQAYPGLLDSAEFSFGFADRPLASANQSQEFQEARKQFMEIEPVFPESYEEMNMNLKTAAYKLKIGSEKQLIMAGLTWIGAFTAVHQVAAFAIRPLNYFPLLPCAFGIGGIIYKGWKMSDDAIELLSDTPNNAAILAHQLTAEQLYNKERAKFMSFPHSWFLTSNGNDWFHDLLVGPTSRRQVIAQNCLIAQIYMSQQEDAGAQREIEKHFKDQLQPKERDIL